MGLIIDKDFIFDQDIVDKRLEQYVRTVKDHLSNCDKPHDRRYKQGYFVPRCPAKWINIMETEEPQIIIWRSSWEKRFCEWCDSNSAIYRCGSEIVKILYFNVLTGKQSFYTPDFYVELLDNNKQIQKYLIEIKPRKEAALESTSNGYDKLMVAKNAKKWQAAIEFCKKRGITFKVLTENELF